MEGIELNEYSVLIKYDNNDKVYTASVLELRGCTAFGKTQEEAIKEINIAMELWLDVAKEEGITIPEPMQITG